MKSSAKFIHFHSRKCIWKYRLWNGGHFVQGGWVEKGMLNRIFITIPAQPRCVSGIWSHCDDTIPSVDIGDKTSSDYMFWPNVMVVFSQTRINIIRYVSRFLWYLLNVSITYLYWCLKIWHKHENEYNALRFSISIIFIKCINYTFILMFENLT